MAGTSPFPVHQDECPIMRKNHQFFKDICMTREFHFRSDLDTEKLKRVTGELSAASCRAEPCP